jgi:energy-converting hydrogenase B subunit D
VGALGGGAARPVSTLQAVALLLAAGWGTAVVLVRDPLRQALVVSVHGIVLAVLFFALQAPDVALSEIVVGSIAVPLMLLLALTRVREGGD